MPADESPMDARNLEKLVEPLLRAAAAEARVWLRPLLTNPESYRAFSALDNELFIRAEPFDGPLLIASSTRGEGRTVVAVLLSVLACAVDPSRRILLVDGDGNHGQLGKLLGLAEDAAGLSEFAEGQARLEDCVHATALPNLFLVPAARSGHRSAYLSPKGFESFVDLIRDQYDLTVIDSPAGGQSKHILSMARCVRNVLLVVKYGGPTREQLVELVTELRRARAEVLGCILNQREFVVPNLFYGHR
jgi:Mrp family chromosome partitioning ATPase